MFRYEKSSHERKSASSEYADEEVYDGDDPETAANYNYAPGKILAFAKINGELNAIILTCEYKHLQAAPFVTKWSIEYKDKARTKPLYSINSVNSIVWHCLMIPKDSTNRIFLKSGEGTDGQALFSNFKKRHGISTRLFF